MMVMMTWMVWMVMKVKNPISFAGILLSSSHFSSSERGRPSSFLEEFRLKVNVVPFLASAWQNPMHCARMVSDIFTLMSETGQILVECNSLLPYHNMSRFTPIIFGLDR